MALAFSVYLFRTMPPMPIVLKPSAPPMLAEMQVTFFAGAALSMRPLASRLRERLGAAVLRAAQR